MAVTDALEMQAVSATVGMEEGAVLALLAGADALCLGHDIDEGHVATRPRRRSSPQFGSGRLGEERLAEAAVRVAASHAPEPLDETVGPSFVALGSDAARRALRVDGDRRGPGTRARRRARRDAVRRGRPAVTRSRVDHA